MPRPQPDCPSSHAFSPPPTAARPGPAAPGRTGLPLVDPPRRRVLPRPPRPAGARTTYPRRRRTRGTMCRAWLGTRRKMRPCCTHSSGGHPGRGGARSGETFLSRRRAPFSLLPNPCRPFCLWLPCSGVRVPVPHDVTRDPNRQGCRGPVSAVIFSCFFRGPAFAPPIPRHSDEPDGFVRAAPSGAAAGGERRAPGGREKQQRRRRKTARVTADEGWDPGFMAAGTLRGRANAAHPEDKDNKLGPDEDGPQSRADGEPIDAGGRAGGGRSSLGHPAGDPLWKAGGRPPLPSPGRRVARPRPEP